MRTLDDVGKTKRLYTAPQLTVHGTLTDITLMRFKWPDREGGGGPDVCNVS